MKWNEITLSFIEHGIWPIVILIALVILARKGDFTKVLESLQSLKFGSFSITTKEAAKKVDVFKEYEKLSELSNNQLHLFLVIGGEGGETSIYQNKINPQEFAAGIKKLSDLELIESEQKENGIHFKNTKKGIKLHKVIMDNLYSNIVIGN